LCETLGLGQFATMLLATIDLTYAAIAFAAAGAGVLLGGADAPRRSGERRTAGSARLRRDARYRRLHRQRMPAARASTAPESSRDWWVDFNRCVCHSPEDDLEVVCVRR
jgi:hypothetical protein